MWYNYNVSCRNSISLLCYLKKQLCITSCQYWCWRRWAGFAADVTLRLTILPLTSLVSPPPSTPSLSSALGTNQSLSTKINFSLTQTKNLPVRRESISKVPSVRLPPLPLLTPPHPLCSHPLNNKVMRCISPPPDALLTQPVAFGWRACGFLRRARWLLLSCVLPPPQTRDQRARRAVCHGSRVTAEYCNSQSQRWVQLASGEWRAEFVLHRNLKMFPRLLFRDGK